MTTRRHVLAGLSASAIATPFAAKAKPWTDTASNTIESLRQTGRYLPLWLAASDGHDPMITGLKPQLAAWYGEEAIALASKPMADDVADNLDGAAYEDAIATIVAASRGRRVVILNEAHNASRHRNFLARVLRALRVEGFDTFAAETFEHPPHGTAGRLKRGDQVGFECGFYTQDPVFAEAVREALDLGYSLVAYEQKPDQEGPPAEAGGDAIRRREQAQAENFAALMVQRPQARFLVHVGYGHIEEQAREGQPAWFAARLPAVAGIDPLTVEQARLGSFRPHARDVATIAAVLARAQPTRPIAVRKADGHYLWTEHFSTDLSVVHPSLPDVALRPGWLAADPARRRIDVPLGSIPGDGLVLAQAIHLADKDPAIPADQYLLPKGARGATFFLRPGPYRVRLETGDGFTPVREIVV